MKKEILFLWLLLSDITGFTQTASFSPSEKISNDHLKDSIISFQTMHVHFDKDIYLPGETIWFKAYLFNVNEISIAATNFYASIYDEKGILIRQKQYPILDGFCYGDFELPDSIQSNRIQFRAFTKAMISEDSNNMYEKILPVYNKNFHPDSIIITNKSLQFFPEGGQIIAELENEIAFKSSYTDGSPAIVNGQIIEVERNKRIDTFYTDQLGLGKFILTPSPKKHYQAVWKDEKGNIQITPLPDINRYGVSFHVTMDDKWVKYSIVKNSTTDSLNNLHIVAQSGNFKVYKADLNIPAEMEVYTVKFSIDSVPPGLMQLTLFDSYWNPLQQKLVFINDTGLTNRIMVQLDTINTNAKGKNTLQIILPDTMFTSLSVSIADIGFYNTHDIHSITQDLLLNTQINELYLNANNLIQNDYSTLDLLIQTHPWKKYNWQKLVYKNNLKQEFMDNYITLNANYNQQNFTLPDNDALNLIISNNELNKQFYNLKPATPYTFKKNNFIFFDSVRVNYQMDKNKELTKYLTVQKTDTIKIASQINPLYYNNNYSIPQNKVANNPIQDFAINQPSRFNSVQTIKEVVVKSKNKGNPILNRLDELDKFYTTGMFSGTRGFQLNVIDDSVGSAANNNLGDYIRNRVPGLSMMDGDLGVKKKIESHDSRGNYIIKDTIFRSAFFIDEIERESSDLQLLNMWNVAYVKYIPGIVIGAGFRSIYGAIYVYTKKGNEKGPTSQGLPYVYIKGYSSQKEFNSLDYDAEKDLIKQPDLRTTLYWNPNIILGKGNNKATIVFYNNDISKKILLKIEGITATGKLIYLEKIIQ